MLVLIVGDVYNIHQVIVALGARRQSSHEITPYSSNDWKVSILTGSAGTSANVTLWVYGSRGSTGPIALGKGNEDHLFQPRQEDEFKVITVNM